MRVGIPKRSRTLLLSTRDELDKDLGAYRDYPSYSTLTSFQFSLLPREIILLLCGLPYDTTDSKRSAYIHFTGIYRQ